MSVAGRNLIKKLDNMDGLGNKLEQLWVSYNSLTSLSGVEKLKCLKVRRGRVRVVSRTAQHSTALHSTAATHTHTPPRRGIVQPPGQRLDQLGGEGGRWLLAPFAFPAQCRLSVSNWGGVAIQS